MAKCGERASHDRLSMSRQQGVSRYLGLSIGGAKSDRTCLTVIDYYYKQNKAFIVDIFESIGAGATPSGAPLTADQVLLELIRELRGEEADEFIRVLGVDAPLTLPPCLENCDTDCGGYEVCKKPPIKWMRHQYERARARHVKVKHFTPYTQRPVDLYFRYRFPDYDLFQDETLGANLAPQAARISYLKKRLDPNLKKIEVWPKLALYMSYRGLRLSKRDALSYRQLEKGAAIRERILDRLAEHENIFIYERDRKKMVRNIAAFDSLLTAWVALLYDTNRVETWKGDLPIESGWVQVPAL